MVSGHLAWFLVDKHGLSIVKLCLTAIKDSLTKSLPIRLAIDVTVGLRAQDSRSQCPYILMTTVYTVMLVHYHNSAKTAKFLYYKMKSDNIEKGHIKQLSKACHKAISCLPKNGMA